MVRGTSTARRSHVGAAILRLAAGAGIVLAALYVGVSLLGGGWCWVQLQYLLLFVLGSGLLLRLRRWEGIAAGACCWLSLILQYNFIAVESGLADRIAYLVLVAGFVIILAGYAWIAGRWLCGLPLPRKYMVPGVCSLLVGITFVLYPYLVARFRGARANLRCAELAMDDLHRADLQGAHLQHANLRFACLQGADLAGADLRSTCLDGVDLTGADLTGARLTDALFDRETTHWPAHFDPEAHGAVERIWL
jgi:pentapeptide repeat protein